MDALLAQFECDKEELDQRKEQNAEELSIVTSALADLKKRFTELSVHINGTSTSIEDFNLISFMEEFNSHSKNIKEVVLQDRGQLAENENRLEELKKKHEELQKRLTSKLNELGYADYETYKKQILSPSERDELLTQADLFKEELTATITQISTLTKDLADVVHMDTATKREELAKLTSTLAELKNRLQLATSSYDNDVKIENKLQATSKELLKAMDDFSVYEYLYKLASGNIPGKPRVSFEQYIQATYFDMVLVEANKRFNVMTDGRFFLARKNDGGLSSKFALDLDVYDEYTGSKRDVRSLSGGESFKAALSLALGLSDIIQNFAGGIKIDALFIDEGFGSLDDESREQAINILNNLSGNDKLIGIISHVTELKDRIERQIVVTKGKEGSDIHIVV